MLVNFLSLLNKEALTTVGLCVLASLGVAIVMRFFVKPVFLGIDKFINSKYEDGTKVAGIYATVKAIIYTGSAFVLMCLALAQLMKVCTFPLDNSVYLAWLYFVPMYALQFFLDKNMKRIANKVFGLDPVEEPEDEEPEEKPAKPKKVKVYTKKIKYTLDDDGNEVALD